MGFDTPNGTRGAKQPRGRLLRWANALTGKLVARTGGLPSRRHRALVLVTVGRRSGEERRSPVRCFPQDDGSWVIIASAAGAAKNPAWYLNLAAHPDRVTVELAAHRVPVTARQLHGEERAEVWRQITTAAPQFADYQRRTDRELPVISLTRRAT